MRHLVSHNRPHAHLAPLSPQYSTLKSRVSKSKFRQKKYFIIAPTKYVQIKGTYIGANFNLSTGSFGIMAHQLLVSMSTTRWLLVHPYTFSNHIQSEASINNFLSVGGFGDVGDGRQRLRPPTRLHAPLPLLPQIPLPASPDLHRDGSTHAYYAHTDADYETNDVL